MAKIAYILLCHKEPDAVIRQAERLTAAGDCLAIHFDARASAHDFQQIRDALKDNPNVTFAKKRIKCGWAEWSLVQASLNALDAALETFPRATHFYMLSGDCMPIKSAGYMHRVLDAEDVDYIECEDFLESDWIKTGWKEERLVYRHYFNERSQPKRFYAAFNLQKKLGLTRKIPADLQIMIGSQWWCLRRRTVERILNFIRERPDVTKFFRSTWIPDETFFQTMAHHLVPEVEIKPRSLTFLMFSDYGMPVTFYNDHYDLLLAQDFLFARKISPEAGDLKQRLGALYASDTAEFQISNEGRKLFAFLTGRGRNGHRFGQRIWEAQSTLGRDRTLLIVMCKKWHVAKRLLAQMQKTANIPAVEYLFDEEHTALPDLGGIQSTLTKRNRHRRAFTRLLFDHYDSDQLLICLDPGNLGMLQDFYGDRATTKLLEIDCRFSDDYLIGHAGRLGLAGAGTPRDTLDALLPTLRNDLAYERNQIRDSGFDNHYRISEAGTGDEIANPLAAFLGISTDKAQEIAQTEHLFSD